MCPDGRKDVVRYHIHAHRGTLREAEMECEAKLFPCLYDHCSGNLNLSKHIIAEKCTDYPHVCANNTSEQIMLP